MEVYVTEALKEELEDLTEVVLEVPTASAWDGEMLCTPENATRLVTV